MDAKEIKGRLRQCKARTQATIRDLHAIQEDMSYRQALQYADCQAAITEAETLKHWLTLLGENVR